jgi:CubicO group peptidase (beta-lactamase class C family)
MFVGVAVAQLAEQGRLSFNDPIRKYLPEHPRQITQRVTIHHLLTHTSGLASFVDPEGYSEVQLLSTQDSLAVFFRKGLSFEPGERWQYSNAGYITLEAIVERVSGQSFSAYIEEHIFKPAGMSQTYGSFSTVEDLLRFSRALRENKLLNRENTAKIVSGRVQTTWNQARYGYGFADLEAHGQRIVGHAGAAPGWNGQLDIYWESGYTVVVLADRDAPVAQRVAVRLRDLLNRR